MSDSTDRTTISVTGDTKARLDDVLPAGSSWNDRIERFLDHRLVVSGGVDVDALEGEAWFEDLVEDEAARRRAREDTLVEQFDELQDTTNDLLDAIRYDLWEHVETEAGRTRTFVGDESAGIQNEVAAAESEVISEVQLSRDRLAEAVADEIEGRLRR